MGRSRRHAQFLAGAWLAVSLSGCVSFNWERGLRFEPPDPEAMAELEVGETTLDSALEDLGAPLWVWEYPAEDGEGAALAYGWFQSQDRGVRVRAPLGRASPSFTYNRIDSSMQGLVLFFDANWRLQSWREGLLVDLTAELVKRRPAYLEPESDVEEHKARVAPRPEIQIGEQPDA